MDQPLLVTSDSSLAEELTRLAAAAGVTLAVVPPAAALVSWASAPVVLVGADASAALVALAPGRRPGVHLVCWSPPPDGVFRDALLLGAQGVVELPAGAAWVAEALTDLGDARPEAPLVGVLPGAGGAGATTFTCALGQLAARHGPALVVDLDPLGPGCDRVLGADERPGVRWDSLGRSSGRLSARSLREAVPSAPDGPGVLTWPPGPSSPPDATAVREALSAARRGHDLVVVDLPRSTDPLVLETVSRCTRVVVLVPATVAGVASTVRLLGALPVPLPVGVVVRGGAAVDHQRIADLVGAPSLAALPDQRGLAEALDLGLGPVRGRRGPLARAAAEVLATLPSLVEVRGAVAPSLETDRRRVA